MRYKNFEIANYKGIHELKLDLEAKPDTKIFTLVGLNESGKTTILEAINDFEFKVPDNKLHLLIPKSSAGGFTGDVRIKALLALSDADLDFVKKFIGARLGVKPDLVSCGNEITVERIYHFENSQPKGSERNLRTTISFLKSGSSKIRSVDTESRVALWKEIEKTLFPEIIFYRDFLSKFPEKIYLDHQDDKEKEYAQIIDDVLVSINPNYSISSSLLDRLVNPSSANKQALEAVENELGAKISEVVFNAWSAIQNVSPKEIVVKTEKDENGRFYIKISVKEGRNSFTIAERSLGFRWFFTFLLYTEFRKERAKRSGEILFLLDEPASNLHQKAQKSLLKTFEKITSKSRLIYTTHSHHLVNPDWLNTSYIIKNKGLNYSDNDNFNAAQTEIEAYKYKQFVSQYPTETSYFQPVLDVLDHQPGLLELVPNIVLLEGKFDFFTLKYFNEIVLGSVETKFGLYPGSGAGCLDLPISLYEAWGRNYVVLLDDDQKGIREKKRYSEDVGNPTRIFTLADFDPSCAGKMLEELFSEEEKIKVCREFNSALGDFEKGAFNTGIQTLYSEKRIPEYLSDATKEKFKTLIGFLNSKF